MSADKGNKTLEESAELLMTFEGHSEPIYAMAITPDGKNVVSAATGDGLKVWSFEPGLCVTDVKTADFTDWWTMVITADGEDAVGASLDGTLKVFNLKSAENKADFEGHSGYVYTVAISQDGKTVVSGSVDKTLKVWDFASRLCRATFKGHSGDVRAVAITSDGTIAVSGSDDKTLKVWQLKSGKCLATFEDHDSFVLTLAITPDNSTVVSGSIDKTLKVWDLNSGRCRVTLEGHTGIVRAVAISPDGKTIVSASDDQTIKVWDIESGQCLATLIGHTGWISSVAITPDGEKIVSASEDTTLKVWDLQAIRPSDYIPAKSIDSVRYTTAKLVLVGDSGVGKTGLGWRLAHNEFKEHASTHGQQFWVIDDLGQTREGGIECEAILWDLAGQPDYRLVHSLFLDDVDTALVLFDPTNRQEPLAGVDFWLNQLKSTNSILVGARTDRGTSTLTVDELDDYCQRNDIDGGYIPTCAASGEGLPRLISQLKTQIPWQTMTTTVTTLTFKQIKRYVLGLKERVDQSNVLVTPELLREQLQATDADWQFTHAEMMTAVGHLANHGYVTLLRGSGGNQSILLATDLLVNLVSSMVLKARSNRQGLGVLEEHQVLAGDYDFAELRELAGSEREILSDAAAMLFLQRNLCFREAVGNATLLVFPSLINEKRPSNVELVTVEGASYQVKGAIENLYASLVVQLGYTNTFTRTDQWQNQAQYEMGEGKVCGFTQHDRGQGEIELVIYYAQQTPESVQSLFRSLFEHFLDSQPLEVFRYLPVICSNKECGEQLARNVVLSLLKKDKMFSFCNYCSEKLTLPDPALLSQLAPREQNEAVKQQVVAKHRTAFEAALVRVKRLIGDKSPTCFISYAWGVTVDESWVKQLATDLRHAGVQASLDLWDSLPGSNLDDFIERIPTSDFVLVVGTPALQQKYHDKEADPVVAAEIKLINLLVRKSNQHGNKVLPLLLDGDADTAFSPQLQPLVSIDFRATELYFRRLFDMIWHIYGLPFDHALLAELQASMTSGEKVRW